MEEGHELHEEHASVSRRSALKRLGAGAALVWSAPVLQSLASPAHAQASPTATCASCSDVPCTGQTLCQESGNACLGGVCGCVKTTEGDCFCYCNFSCGSVPTCSSSADCPSGQRCSTLTCCGGPPGSCLPPCPNPAPFSNANVEIGKGNKDALGVS